MFELKKWQRPAFLRLGAHALKAKDWTCQLWIKWLLHVCKASGVMKPVKPSMQDWKEFREGTYQVKTRNWRCQLWVKFLLDISKRFGVERGDNYTDGDGKYILHTPSRIRAWGMWTYFMMVWPASGGWTYICRPGRHVDAHYRHVY